MVKFIGKIRQMTVVRIILLITLVATIMGFSFNVYSTSNSIKYVDPNSDIVDVLITNRTIEQHFYANEPVRAIELTLYQNKIQGPTRIAATLINADNDSQVGYSEKTFDLDDSANVVRFEFPDTESEVFAEYYFTLEVLDKNRQVYTKATENDYSEELYVNDLIISQRLLFEAIYANYLLLGFFILTTILLTISLALLFFPIQLALRPEQLFIVLALISGIAITFISPAGQEPDGGDHILRAFDVSYGNFTPIFSRANDNIVQMPLNFSEFDDRVVGPGQNKGLAHASHMREVYFSNGEDEVQDYRYKENYVPMTYWPQGFGLFLGRVYGWNSFNMVALARIMNLLTYILLTYVAIRKIPVFKHLMMVIALIPISIAQAGSLSADAVIHGFSFLYVALIMNLVHEKMKINPLRLILPIVLLYIVFISKPAYITLGLLILMIPLKSYPKPMDKILKYFLIVAASATFAALLFGFSSGALMLTEDKAVDAYSTQMEYVLHNLIPTISTLIRTLDVSAYQYLTWLNMLGWISYSLGVLIIVVPVYIVLIGLSDLTLDFNLKIWQKILIWGAFLGAIAAIFVGLYIFDDVNDIGASLMLGAQGRYFIPLLILPFLAIKPPLRFVQSSTIGPKIAAFSGLMLVYTQYTLTRLIY